MPIRRTSRRHQAGVVSADYADFAVGQPVLTIEGFPGVVTEVMDGPYPGSEQYTVLLDAGMGGGDYAADELSPVAGTVASFQGSAPNLEIEAADVKAAVIHTAAEDYPELAEILQVRPPLAHAEPLHMSAAKTADSERTPCTVCGGKGWVDLGDGEIGSKWERTTCSLCKGHGYLLDKTAATYYLDTPESNALYDAASMVLSEASQAMATVEVPDASIEDGTAQALALSQRPDLVTATDPRVTAAKTDWLALHAYYVCEACQWAGNLEPVTDIATGAKVDVCPRCGNRTPYEEIDANGWPLVNDPLAPNPMPVAASKTGNVTRSQFHGIITLSCDVCGESESASVRVEGGQEALEGFEANHKHTDKKISEAGLHGDLPAGITITDSYRRDPSGEPAESGICWVIARKGEEFIGSLSINYDEDPATIFEVSVEPQYQRMGVASALLEHARKRYPSLVHSDSLTDDGRAWRQTVADKKISAAADEHVFFATAGLWDKVLSAPTDLLNSQMKPEWQYQEGTSHTTDWCRFRHDERCMFPKTLNEAATKEAGYAVWVPEDRGRCPRQKWTEQQTCPVSEPGPNSGDPGARVDATVPWEQGGQRGGRPAHAALIKDAGFEFTATWADVRQKAKRIRAEGGVRIISAPRPGDETLTLSAEVKGDTHVYETTLLREPGKQNVASWRCGCAWAAYSWGRSPAYKRYEGRMCSHALALQYEAQAQGMFGRTVVEQAETPPWRLDNDPFTYTKPDRDRYTRAAARIRPVYLDPGLYEAPSAVVARLEKTALVGTQVLVHDTVKQVVKVSDLGVYLADGTVVPYSQVRYPTYDPLKGLTWSSKQAALAGAFAFEAAKEDAPEVPTHAGLVLKAADTGRVLMLQRCLQDEDDPAAGTWEFPGGGREDEDDTSLHAAMREFAEEVGHAVPTGGHVSHVWTSANGVYVGHVVVIPSESDLPLHEGRSETNPDDPDGDYCEQSAWWDPDDAKKNPALRTECKESPWAEIKKAAAKTAALLTLDQARAAAAEDLDIVLGVNGVPLSEWVKQGDTAKKHDEPEPALPTTDGAEEQVVNPSDRDIALHAKAFLAKTSLKEFSPAEQREIIEEGLDVQAANLADLDLTGTHYLGLEAAFAAAEDDDEELLL